MDGSNALHTTTHTRDSSGDLTSSNINDGRPRTVNFTNDVSGQVIDRTEVSPAASEPREIRYRFGGREMGMSGNNGDVAQMDYAQAAADRTITPDAGANGAFRHGSTSDDRVADFNNSFDPINSYAQGSRAGTYMARGGETFSALAASLYGDSALWYKLAQANPAIASPDVALSAGQTVRLPANVMRNSFNASTFAPYDPGEAIGDLSPTTPEPPKEGGQNCGVVGSLLLVVVAVAVTAITKNFNLGAKIFAKGIATGSTAAKTAAAVVTGASAGAAGSVASQGVGVATGIQDKFNWKAVGLAAIGGGVGASGFGNAAAGQTGIESAFLSNAVSGAASNVLTQGLGVATGLQESFSWAGVAAASVGAGVGGRVGSRLGATPLSGVGADLSLRNISANFGQSSASALANAATRSALDGSNFGDNITAAIPDVIGQVLGDAVGGKIAQIAQNYRLTIEDRPPEVLAKVLTTENGRLEFTDEFKADSLAALSTGLTALDFGIRRFFLGEEGAMQGLNGEILLGRDELLFNEAGLFGSVSGTVDGFSEAVLPGFLNAGIESLNLLLDAATYTSANAALLAVDIPTFEISGRDGQLGALFGATAFNAFTFGVPGSEFSAGRTALTARPLYSLDNVAQMGADYRFLDVPVNLGVVYERIDVTGQLGPYGGQSKNLARFLDRQGEHALAHPNSIFDFKIVDRALPGLQLDIAEHRFIQSITGGVRASRSDLVSNKIDPVGYARRKENSIPHPNN